MRITLHAASQTHPQRIRCLFSPCSDCCRLRRAILHTCGSKLRHAAFCSVLRPTAARRVADSATCPSSQPLQPNLHARSQGEVTGANSPPPPSSSREGGLDSAREWWDPPSAPFTPSAAELGELASSLATDPRHEAEDTAARALAETKAAAARERSEREFKAQESHAVLRLAFDTYLQAGISRLIKGVPQERPLYAQVERHSHKDGTHFVLRSPPAAAGAGSAAEAVAPVNPVDHFPPPPQDGDALSPASSVGSPAHPAPPAASAGSVGRAAPSAARTDQGAGAIPPAAASAARTDQGAGANPPAGGNDAAGQGQPAAGDVVV